MKEERKTQPCKYCDITDDFKQEFMGEIAYDIGKSCTALEVILIDEIYIGPAIGITLGDIVDESIPIKYCPMCGRKLVE